MSPIQTERPPGSDAWNVAAHPLVSIIIPCHNAEQWVGEAIQSALDQSWPEKEIIVVDDGSVDGSREVIKTFGDRIRMEISPHQGGCAARNRGLALARGEWVQFLDADDLLVRDCVERKLNAPNKPGVVPCCNLNYLSFVARTGEDGGPAFWSQPSHDLDYMLEFGPPPVSAPLHRREQLLAVGGFRRELPCAQEFDLHLRMAIQLNLSFESNGTVGMLIRPHPASVSRSSGYRMPLAMASILLHCADLLEERGRLTESRRILIAQRSAKLAVNASRQGGMEEAAPLAAGAKKLSDRWHEQAYTKRLSSVMVRAGGFRLYEMLHARYERLRRVAATT